MYEDIPKTKTKPVTLPIPIIIKQYKHDTIYYLITEIKYAAEYLQ